jgi:hypothetical protein
MLRHISIRGLGPHDAFSAELDPVGVTVVTGASETGKTTLLDALLLALWGESSRGGLDVAQVRDGHEEAILEVGLDDDRVVRRAVTRARRQTRTIRLGSIQRTFTSEKAFQDGLGELGRDPEAARLVVCPMAWTELLDNKARPLRDALSRILPRGDTASEVRTRMAEAGFAVSEAEAEATDKQVEAWRKEARDRLSGARGQVTYLEKRVGELAIGLGAAPDHDAAPLAAARATLELAAAWEAWERKARGCQLQLRAAEELTAWRTRRATLGDEPQGGRERLEAAREAERRSALALKALIEEATGEKARLEVAKRGLEALEAAGDSCPTCARPGWDEAAAKRSEVTAEVAAHEARLAAIVGHGKAARTAHEQARQALEDAQTAHAARDAWRAGLAALGPAPLILEGAAAVEPPPASSCPSPAAVTDARALVDAARTADGARQQRVTDLTAARADLAAALALMANEEALGEQLDALRDAVRAAPSEVARRQARALGDLGPVSLVFGEDPSVEVRVDGRPWWLASRGRQVVADLWLRSGLRRALDLPQLPIVVDNVQDVGGQPLPEVEGPLILLRTSDAPGLSVTRRDP